MVRMYYNSSVAKAPIIETHIRTRSRKTEKKSFLWQIVKGVLRLLVLALFLVLVWYVTRLPLFTITTVAVSGGETISHEEIRSRVETELVGTYFLLVPKRFSYLYPHDRIVEVVEAHPRAHAVSVMRVGRTEIQVAFEEYLPHALLCTDTEEPTCYFMTERGYAFSEAPHLEGGALVRHVKEGVREVREGEVLGRETLTRLDAFFVRLREELSLRVSTIVYKENGDATLAVNGGGTILITQSGDLAVAFDHLKAILASEEFGHIEPGNFQYIDVRFPGKAYVNEEVPKSEMSSSTIATTTDTPLPEQ